MSSATTVDSSAAPVAVDSAELLACKDELLLERQKNVALALQVEQLRKRALSIAVQSEEEEEAISNRLLRRAEELAKEKARILYEVEAEEDMIYNTLQV